MNYVIFIEGTERTYKPSYFIKRLKWDLKLSPKLIY